MEKQKVTPPGNQATEPLKPAAPLPPPAPAPQIPSPLPHAPPPNPAPPTPTWGGQATDSPPARELAQGEKS